MSDTAEDRKKRPELPDDDTSPSTHRRHHRHHHHHHDRNGAGHRETPRGGCYSSANDEEKRSKLFAELSAERDRLDPIKCPHLYRLIQTEISRVAISPEAEHSQEVDLFNDHPVTLNVKCFPPTKSQPNFNYAGRIIGPRGAYLQALMRETRSKIVVLGHGVMKDKEKEKELRDSGDPKYLHLNEEMHFSVTVSAPATEAYERMSNAISCLKDQVLSDSRDLLSLPWILRVVENGAAPPKGAQIPRRNFGTRNNSREFRRRGSSPRQSPPKRRLIAPPFKEQESRPKRNFDSGPRSSHQPREERPASRSVRSHDDYDGQVRPVRTVPRTAPPAAENFRDGVSSNRNPTRPRTRRSPSYDYGGADAAAEATSSYYAESQDRNPWPESDGRAAPRHQNRR